MAGEGANQRPLLALRPQVGVNRPNGALGGDRRADPAEPGGQPRTGRQGRPLIAALDRLHHVDHVDVANVVELAAATLAHPDHGDPAVHTAARQVGPGQGECGLKRGRGQVGKLPGHRLDDAQRVGRGQIPGRQ